MSRWKLPPPFLDQDICAAMVVTRGKDGMSVIAKAKRLSTCAPWPARSSTFQAPVTRPSPPCPWELPRAPSIVAASTLANLAAGIVVGKLGTAVVTVSELIEQLTPLIAEAPVTARVYTLASVLKLVHAMARAGLPASHSPTAASTCCIRVMYPCWIKPSAVPIG